MKTCFVVMGFGKKTDFETGRTLDLDKTYRNILKPAAEAAGLTCIRADEIQHSGVIDVPMYEQLLGADVVIADVSTANANAYYELGVRHALRPHTTLVIAEDGVKKFPFDINHVTVRQYAHLGTGIDFDEVERFRKVLTDALKAILARQPLQEDSPVYTFLDGLTPPVRRETREVDFFGPTPAAPQPSRPTRSELMEAATTALNAGDFATARRRFAEVRALSGDDDPFVVQQLALATYKSEQPDRLAALREAHAVLTTLAPETTNDPETLGLWGAIHKRLWEETGDAAHLDEAIRAYKTGFLLRNDPYNGINLAFALNLRADRATDQAEAIADFVEARRVRQTVKALAETQLASYPAQPANPAEAPRHREERYWLLATLAEAALGLGDATETARWRAEAMQFAPNLWEHESTGQQLDRLEALLTNSPLNHLNR